METLKITYQEIWFDFCVRMAPIRHQSCGRLGLWSRGARTHLYLPMAWWDTQTDKD